MEGRWLGAAPRLGFLGVGWIGRSRMQTLAEAGASICAICDPSSEMVQKACKLAPGAAVTDSLEDMLAMGLDGVVIATPSAFHAEQAMTALAANSAVFCQKPLGRNLTEVQAVIEAAKASNRLLGLDLSYRHTAAMQAVRSLLREGTIGQVHAVDLVFHNAYGPDKPWFYDAALSGGGCLIDLGVHLVDLLLWALDFPIVVGTHARLLAKGHVLTGKEVEDYALAMLDLEGGQVARLACSWRLHAGCDAVIGATFHGALGSLIFTNVGGSFYDFEAHLARGTSRECLVSPPDAWGGRSIRHWTEHLATDRHFDAEAGQFARVAEVLDRIYQANARRIAAIQDRPLGAKLWVS
ncbi:Gfo/Idh/MocA family protein [Aquamicrobium soli]|uniref:Gfo/Idh/MocA family protein n=1 Tax=Aquamicrobium soli TaxID=1811518 RepID=A0ABV7K5F2_9HYPH